MTCFIGFYFFIFFCSFHLYRGLLFISPHYFYLGISYFFQHSISDSLAMVSPQMMKLMIGFVENNALAGNYTDPDTEEIIVIEGEEQWKGI